MNARGPNGMTPLFDVRTRYVAEFLIAHGADVNACSDSGWTPLHYHVYVGRIRIVEVLLQHGADTSRMCQGQTPLHFAADEPNSEMIRLLVAHGADVNAVTDYGWSPLVIAVFANRYRIVKTLIALGATDNAGLLHYPDNVDWRQLF